MKHVEANRTSANHNDIFTHRKYSFSNLFNSEGDLAQVQFPELIQNWRTGR